MKKHINEVDWKAMDDVIFVPQKKSHLLRNSVLIIVFILVVLFFISPGAILSQFFLFPKDSLSYSSDTSVFCEDRNVSMTGKYTYIPGNNDFDLKTDFVGKISNTYFLPAKNVKLGVRIQGISNPNAQWWMGFATIKEIPPNSTVDFNVRLDHRCVQRDISWKYEILEASY